MDLTGEDHEEEGFGEESVVNWINCRTNKKINCRKLKVKLGFIFLVDSTGYKVGLYRPSQLQGEHTYEIPKVPSATNILVHTTLLVPDITPPLKPLVTNGTSFYRNFIIDNYPS